MEIETLEIFKYIQSCDPISSLSESEQSALTLDLSIVYFKRGNIILAPGQVNNMLFLVRSGAVERVDKNKKVVAKFAEGEFFGYASIKRGGKVLRAIVAVEDTLLYQIPADRFHQLLASSDDFRFYFERNQKSSVSRYAEKSPTEKSHTEIPQLKEEANKQKIKSKNNQPLPSLSYIQVGDLLHGTPQLVDHKTSIQACAKLMENNQVTSLLVTKNEKVVGIITDRAFCTKVVAVGLSYESPIGLIMSENLLTINHDAMASEALLKMARHNFRHLPITRNENIIGVLTATDLIHRQSNNPIYLVNQIHKCHSVEALIIQSKNLPTSLSNMVDFGLKAKDIGYTISSIGRAINQRLLQLAELKFGPPPIEYAWVIAGSKARNDQTGHSDQDNMIILSDEYNAKEHSEYFIQLSKFVSDGLNESGYIYCPGNVMATNEKWRQPLTTWKEYFSDWILSPQPKALMYASIFFDLRCIYGSQPLLSKLMNSVTNLLKKNDSYLNYMAANALHNSPPLGFFRHFILEKNGTEEKALNLKKRGVVPITDLARVYALSCAAQPINTLSRLEAAHANGALSQEGLMDLTDAFEYLSELRLKHQAEQIKRGDAADNYLSPNSLSSLEKRHLKDTFEIVRTYQNALASRFQTGRFG